MGWTYLIVACICEIIFVIASKEAEGWTKMPPTILTISFALLGMWTLSKAFQHFPLTFAYPFWVACGIIGSTLIAIIFLGESIGFGKIFSLTLIIIGAAGLKYFP